MTSADALTEAGKLLADPSRWCQGALARAKTGMPVQPSSARARQWDAIGVIYKVTHCKLDDPSNAVGAAMAGISLAAGRLYRMGIVRVNDELGHEAVMQCLRLACKRARSGP